MLKDGEQLLEVGRDVAQPFGRLVDGVGPGLPGKRVPGPGFLAVQVKLEGAAGQDAGLHRQDRGLGMVRLLGSPG